MRESGGSGNSVHVSIFADIADRFISQKELFATEVLSAVLQEPEPRGAVLDFCRGIAGSIPADVYFRSQVPGDSGCPDVVGFDDSQPVLLIEGKFDASLTDHQPRGYFELLREGGLLLFVVLEKRADHVWREVCARCRINAVTGAGRQATVSGRHIAVTTWNSLLENARAASQGRLSST